MRAAIAEKIAQVTNKAKVVKPILVKNNIYVMEKAEGISLSYLNGYGVSKNLAIAVKWYRKAAKQGDRSAIATLKELGVSH